jgi:hypothetical protein
MNPPKTKIWVITLLLVNTIAIVFLVRFYRHRPQRQQSVFVSASAESNDKDHQDRQMPAFSDNEIVTTSFVEPVADAEGFISLFNGRDLNGWNYNPHIWSVIDGLIVARAPADLSGTAYYMAWAGGTVEDFELHLKVRSIGNVNSGVAVRARWPDQRWMPGYQAEIQGPNTGLFVIAGAGRERKLSRAGWRTAAREVDGRNVLESIESVANPQEIATAHAALKMGEWCDFVVIARGFQFIVRLNSITITDTTDEHPTKFVRRGMLGLEYNHRTGNPDAVEFKEIRFKRLTSNPP